MPFDRLAKSAPMWLNLALAMIPVAAVVIAAIMAQRAPDEPSPGRRRPPTNPPSAYGSANVLDLGDDSSDGESPTS